MLCSLLFLNVVVSSTPLASAIKRTAVVHTDLGPVIGEEVSFQGTNYKSFKGIPYAAPPVGELRFKAPQLPRKWTYVRDATTYGSVCPQLKFINTSSEDCLTLNVYTRSLARNNSKPVLVWIHGGGYKSGSGSDSNYGPEYLVEQNVVVTMNYRLGNLGFLATNTSDATGNWGMKDQVAAMKWVKSNIEQFGGDSKRITIYGQSAGGISVHFHLFSPLSKGLFQQAIISSGSALNIDLLRTPNQQERYSKNLARLLGASEDDIADPQKRVQFLRASDAKDVNGITDEVFDEEDFSNPLFTPLTCMPVIEAAGTEGAFLTEDPLKQLEEGTFTKVPLIIGLNNLEGSLLYVLGYGSKFTPGVRRKIEEDVCQILPRSLKDAVIAKNECYQVAQMIRDVYFDGDGFDSTYLNFVYLWGDLHVNRGVYLTQKMHAVHAGEGNPLYNYHFTFDGEWNMMKKKRNISFPGAAHADDLMYVFRPHELRMPVLPSSAPEVITKNRMISFINNFLKDGNPTPSVSNLVPVKWEPSKKEDFSIMVIGNEGPHLEKSILKTRMELWDTLDEQYRTNFASSAETKHRLFRNLSGWQNVLFWACFAHLSIAWNKP